MNIDWGLFTPWNSLLGGLLIGLATALFLLGNGRVAGISGLAAGAMRVLAGITGLKAEQTSLLFLVGMLAAPWLWRLFAVLPPVSVDVGWVGLLSAGLLVGVGVRMGNGCTSGHGVCGLGRFSLRSLVNVLVFMGAGFASVFYLRHWLQ